LRFLRPTFVLLNTESNESTFRLEPGGNSGFLSVQMPLIFKTLLQVSLCLLGAQVLSAQMTPNAPIKNFKLPRLGDNGYTEWVLQGGRGIYDSPGQVRIEEMGLRIYTGDARMALEMSMDSPDAMVLIAENKAYSDSTIEIVGENFTISGVGWTWDGKTKEIEVLFDSVVKFTQTISDSFGTPQPLDPEVAPKTVICSERLKLKTTVTEYRFEFTNDVHVVSGDMDLKGNRLVAIVDPPEGRKKGSPQIESDKLDSVRQLIAQGDVLINQAGRIVRAQEAEFFPQEKRVKLSGTPQVEAVGAYLSGNTITSKIGQLIVTGGGDVGRAQMILTDTGGLGIQGGGALAAETIVLADKITMLELEEKNYFLFVGAVEVMSGAVHMTSKDMTIFATPSRKSSDANAGTEAETADGQLKVGEVRQMIADGGVRIEQGGQVATSERVTFYPAEERAVMEGDPKVTDGRAVVTGKQMELQPGKMIADGTVRIEQGSQVATGDQITYYPAEERAVLEGSSRVTNGEAIVTGEHMELKPGLAVIRGSETDQVKVVLPEMPDLGYETAAEDSRAQTVAPIEAKDERQSSETTVRSNVLRMIEEPTQTIFRFTENVSVTATNLQASCDRLDVIAMEQPIKDVVSGELKNRLEVQRIEAIDTVEVKQDGRVATAQKAFILPQEGKLILEGNAVVNDDRGKVAGHRMTLLQGQRRAIVEGGGPAGERARITLPEMPSGDF